MDTENFIAEFKKTFVYDILSMSLKDEQLFEHVVDGDGVLWFKEQTRQMWSMWQAAKANPKGFMVVPKEPRQAFESLQCSAVFERLEYIEVGGLYAVKDEFRECIFTLTKCNELNFGWRMYQAAIQKNIIDAIEVREQK